MDFVGKLNHKMKSQRKKGQEMLICIYPGIYEFKCLQKKCFLCKL